MRLPITKQIAEVLEAAHLHDATESEIGYPSIVRAGGEGLPPGRHSGSEVSLVDRVPIVSPPDPSKRVLESPMQSSSKCGNKGGTEDSYRTQLTVKYAVQ